MSKIKSYRVFSPENTKKRKKMKTEKLSYFDGNITIDSNICNGKSTIRG
jgi:hypothetical protein